MSLTEELTLVIGVAAVVVTLVVGFKRELGQLTGKLFGKKQPPAPPATPGKRLVHIGLVLNGDMPYSRRLMETFRSKVEELLDPTLHFPHFEVAHGCPESGEEAEQKNRAVFNELLSRFGRPPMYLVTFGTEVSVYAHRRHSTIPLIFVGVTDPHASGLIPLPGDGQTRGLIAGATYGKDMNDRVAVIARLFPQARLGFVYNSALAQDRIALEKTRAAVRMMTPSPMLIEIETRQPALTPQQLGSADVFFGWSYLTQNFGQFARDAHKPFVGVSLEDVLRFAVAAVSADESEIGRRAASEILVKNLIEGVPLRDMDILQVEENLRIWNVARARRFDYSLPDKDKKEWVVIDDPY